MRNLKKFLALVLTVMMVMGLMVTANAAASAADLGVTNPNYETAALVTNALGLFRGDDTGFEAERELTRVEFAALVYRLVTGDVKDEKVSDYAGQYPFSDVTDTSWSWAAPYVYYVNKEGYMVGDEGKFYPVEKISGVDVVTVLLRLLGYGKEGELTGDGYDTYAVIQADKIGMLGVVGMRELSTSKTITRQTVSQLLFDTLTECEVVLYNKNGADEDAKYPTTHTTYGEWYLGLVEVDDPGDAADAAEAAGEEDYFGRPKAAKGFQIGEKFIVTERAAELIGTFTVENKDTIATVLKTGTTVANNVSVYVNGVDTNQWNDRIYGNTGLDNLKTTLTTMATANNNTVEVYGTVTSGVITVTRVVAINVFANIIDEDDDIDSDDDGDFIVLHDGGEWDRTSSGVGGEYKYYLKDGESFEDGDVVLYTRGQTTPGAADEDEMVVYSVTKATKVTGTLEKISADGSTYTINGTDYVISHAVGNDGVTVPSIASNFTKPYIFYVGPHYGIVKVVDPEAAEEEPDDTEDEPAQYFYVLNYAVTSEGESLAGGPGADSWLGEDAADAPKKATAKAQVVDLATGDIMLIDIAIVQGAKTAQGGTGDSEKWVYAIAKNGKAVAPDAGAGTQVQKNVVSGAQYADMYAKTGDFKAYTKVGNEYVLAPVENQESVTAPSEFGIAAGKAVVTTQTTGSTVTKIAGSSTKLVIINAVTEGGDTTYTVANEVTGYTNFPTVAEGNGVTITAALVVLKSDTDDTVAEIYVIMSGTITQGNDDLAIFVEKGGTVAQGIAYTFIVNGKTEIYFASEALDPEPDPGKLYTLKFADDKLTAADAASSPLKSDKELDRDRDGNLLVVDSDVYYMAEDCVVYVVNKSAATGNPVTGVKAGTASDVKKADDHLVTLYGDAVSGTVNVIIVTITAAS